MASFSEALAFLTPYFSTVEDVIGTISLFVGGIFGIYVIALIMRFIFLPYDAVSYLAGFLKTRFWPFILATALGSIPGTMAFIGFGASIESFDGVLPKFNPVTLGFSIAIFIISIALSRIFKKREGMTKSDPVRPR